jgi:hypothetical protein
LNLRELRQASEGKPGDEGMLSERKKATKLPVA